MKKSLASLLQTRDETFAPMTKSAQRAILDYIGDPEPTHTTWKGIRGTVISSNLRHGTVWQAVLKLEGVAAGSRESYVPNPLSVARAISRVLNKEVL